MKKKTERTTIIRKIMNIMLKMKKINEARKVTLDYLSTLHLTLKHMYIECAISK